MQNKDMIFFLSVSMFWNLLIGEFGTKPSAILPKMIINFKACEISPNSSD